MHFIVFLFLCLFKICQESAYNKTFEDMSSFSDVSGNSILVDHYINDNKAFEQNDNFNKSTNTLYLDINYDSFA